MANEETQGLRNFAQELLGPEWEEHVEDQAVQKRQLPLHIVEKLQKFVMTGNPETLAGTTFVHFLSFRGKDAPAGPRLSVACADFGISMEELTALWEKAEKRISNAETVAWDVAMQIAQEVIARGPKKEEVEDEH